MYEKIAWNNFYKTGNIESFLEYREFCKLNNINNKNCSNNINIDDNITMIKKDAGENLGEFN